MGSGERKRCSNMAPVRRLRSLAWMKARKLPGVRCSTLKTECRSLLCLMIMPGRSWVAGIAIAGYVSLSFLRLHWRKAGRPHFPPDTGFQLFILHGLELIWEQHPDCYRRNTERTQRTPKRQLESYKRNCKRKIEFERNFLCELEN